MPPRHPPKLPSLSPSRYLQAPLRHASRLRTRLDIPPPFPVTATCPDPSCACPPTPAMPDGLPIDHAQPLNGSMAAYAQQLLICTGQRDWTSRIENDGEDKAWGDLARGLKRLMGRGGRFADPFNNILVSSSSLATSSSSSTASGFLFPSFKYFPSIPVAIPDTNTQTGPEPEPDATLSTFVRAFLLPPKLHPMQEAALPEPKRAELTRVPDLASKLPPAVDIHHSPVVLICGHGGRDLRCGIMAPVLEAEFARILARRGFTTNLSGGGGGGGPDVVVDRENHAHIGLISHVGGHKYAGNVIVYIPPGMTASNALAGKGIWYGRVEPRHVEGIVQETVLGGRVVADHFRGGIGRHGEILRM